MKNSSFIICGLVLLIIGCTGCATSFVGSSYVSQGAYGCEIKCEEQGMTLAGMVFLGEYTDGCICAMPGHEKQALDAAGTVTGGAVGVIMQMRRQEQQSTLH